MLDWSKVKLISIGGKYPRSAGYKDEECSKEAAKKVNPKLRDRQKQVLRALAEAKGGATIDEVAETLNLHRDAIKPRFSELKELGYIRKTGRKGKTVLGGVCAIWELTHFIYDREADLIEQMHTGDYTKKWSIAKKFEIRE